MRRTMKHHPTISAVALLVAGTLTAGAYPCTPAVVGPVTPGQAFNLAGYTYAPINTSPASRSTRSTYVYPGQTFNLAGYTYAPVSPENLAPTPATPPQEQPAPTPQPKATPSPWSVEIAGSANFATRPIMRADWEELAPKVNTYGADITVARTITSGLSANIRFGFAYGSDSLTYSDDGYSERYKVTDFILMPGLRYTFGLSENAHLFLGANIGIISRSLKCREYDNFLGAPEGYYPTTIKWHDSDYAFTYSAEIGLRYNITPHIGLFAAYQFSGSSAHPKRAPQEEWDDASYSSPRQYHNTVRCGLSCTF